MFLDQKTKTMSQKTLKHPITLRGNGSYSINTISPSHSVVCFIANQGSYLATWGRGQYIVGVHGAQLVPAPVPAWLALDADDLVDAF